MHLCVLGMPLPILSPVQSLYVLLEKVKKQGEMPFQYSEKLFLVQRELRGTCPQTPSCPMLPDIRVLVSCGCVRDSTRLLRQYALLTCTENYVTSFQFNAMHISVFIQTLIPSDSEATTVLVCCLQVLLKGV